MNKEKVSMVLLAAVLGILVGIQFKSNFQEKLELSYMDSQLITEINKARNMNKELLIKKEILSDQLRTLEKSKIKDSITKKYKDNVEQIRTILSYEDVQGPGIIITIDSKEESNIGILVEEKKIFVNLLNEIKNNNGESISINDQKIGPYSEMVLAGEHININSVPIAQPYEIKIIGDKSKLYKTFSKNNVLIEMMRNEYGLSVIVSEKDDIVAPKLEREKEFKFVVEKNDSI